MLFAKLSAIADQNELDPEIVAQLSGLAGDERRDGGHALIDTKHVRFRPTVRQAIKALFSQVHVETVPAPAQHWVQKRTQRGAKLRALYDRIIATLTTKVAERRISSCLQQFTLSWCGRAGIGYGDNRDYGHF
jgi:hypothetical protein